MVRRTSALGKSSAHYTADNYRTVEESKDKGLQRYMSVERGAITEDIDNASERTFVDLGAGYGRVVPYVSKVAHNVIAIELNSSMFAKLKANAKTQANVEPVFGDVMDLSEILAARHVNKPVIMLLQNTLAVIGGVGNIQAQHELLKKMRKFAIEHGGEIVLSLFKQEALESMGVPMYETFSFAGEVDLGKSGSWT
jgi:tRNA G37 N-methylase Trm5